MAIKDSPRQAALALLALLGALLILTTLLAGFLGPGPRRSADDGIKEFSLADVELLHTSEFKRNMDVNLQFLMMLDVDRLAYNFRLTAGLDTPGESFGGWEDSSVEVRGQFMGHYLSAMAFAYRNTGDEKFSARAADFIAALDECQSKMGTGYLSAFPTEHFDRLEALKPVWAPYYVIHKIMQGLLHQHQLAGHPYSLRMARKMAAYHCGRIERVLSENGAEYWEKCLETEFGGMNEILYNMYMETGDPYYERCAHYFDKPAFYRPMVEGRDILPGLHGNTHLAQVNGFGARYESTGDKEARTAVSNFFSIMLHSHSFSTGGNNWFEFWHPPHTIGDALNDTQAGVTSEESCTQYNMLKIARYLFKWTGDAALADYYERAILNDVIGIQHLPSSSPPSNHHHHHHHHLPPSFPPAHALNHHHRHHHSSSFEALPLHVNTHDEAAEGAEHAEAVKGAQGVEHAEAAHNAEAAEGAERAEHAEGAQGHRQLLGFAQGEAAGGGVDFSAMAAAYAAQPRPENYQVVSWPNDPGRRALGNTSPLDSPGVYIYYLPLGAGTSKGDSRVWTQGWGDPFHSFWCCYGTAVESLSKLADSIYFRRKPKGKFPELFVNQLVSSKLRWRELGVVLTMEADIYGPQTAALATLHIHLPTACDTHHTGACQGREATASFVLNWRIPSWTDVERVNITVNGVKYDGCAQGAKAAAAEGGRAGNTARPGFGKGARFCSLGPKWSQGDKVEISMPMRYIVEDANDDRPQFQGLKAVMMGPLLMAGLTNSTRQLSADPDSIDDTISVPVTRGLVSLEVSGPQSQALLLRHMPDGTVQLVPKEGTAANRASALDATFRLVPSLAGETGGVRGEAAAARAGAKKAEEGEEKAGEGEGEGEGEEGPEVRLSLESMSRPGLFLSADEQGVLTLFKPATSQDRLRASFAVRDAGPVTIRIEDQGGHEKEGRAVLLEPLSAPGAPLRLLPSEGATALRLVAPAAPHYPPGARLLQGQDQSYLLVPLGQIQDEVYTAYFDFTTCTEGKHGKAGLAAKAGSVEDATGE